MKKIVFGLMTLLLFACSAPQQREGRSLSAGKTLPITSSPCNELGQEGCVRYDILVVQHDASVPELAALVSARESSYRLAPVIFDLERRGVVKRAKRCVPVGVFNWQVNQAVPTSHMATYNPSREAGIQMSDVTKVSAPVFVNAPQKGELASLFEEEVCGKKTIQFPWAYITSETYSIICPFPMETAQPAKLHYPRGQGKAREGLHFTTNFWKHASRDWSLSQPATWEYIQVVIVVDENS